MYFCYFQSQPYTIGTILSVPGVTATVDPAANIDINNSSQIASEVADLSMGSRKRSHPACKFFWFKGYKQLSLVVKRRFNKRTTYLWGYMT